MIEEKWDCIVNFPIKRKEKKLPKTWKEFCDMFPIKAGECSISPESEIISEIIFETTEYIRHFDTDRNYLPDYATAEAVLTLCQLIQLRNAYNGDWVPDWGDDTSKFSFEFTANSISRCDYSHLTATPLFFKSEELRDESVKNFRPPIEKLKPLYGIKEGGEEC